MTMPAWPTCLPLPMIAGYTVNMGDANNARGGGGYGPATSRNRLTRQSSAVSVAYVFTELQLGIFEAWWKHIAREGAGWFTQTHAGEGLETNTVRFVGGYSASLQTAGVWAVSATVVIDDPYRSA